jgi:hypothetical protein
MFTIEYKKTQQCHIQELNPSFLFNLHQGMVTNEHQYVTKMTLNASVGDLWGNFTTMFWIIQYLQRPIYIWNKISKCIMSRCDMDFQSIVAKKEGVLWRQTTHTPSDMDPGA